MTIEEKEPQPCYLHETDCTEPHTCPYSTEIHDNYDLCTCCAEQSSNCCEEI